MSENNTSSGTTFVARLTKPGAGNKYYIRKASGGYSDAIKGSPVDSECDVLANCVGYAVGRFNEIGGWGCCRYLSPVNAELFIQYKGPTLEVGQTPRLGACMVWQKGATLNGSDGAGHVAIVEQVISDAEVLTSESGYGSKAFWTQQRKKGDGNWGQGLGYTFLGFIYNPALCCQSSASSSGSTGTSTGITAGSTGSTGTTLGSSADSLKVGDIVTFTGSKHYASANATSGPTCKPGKAKVTQIYQTGKHPVHLVAESGGGSTVYGWVDVADISGAGDWIPAVGDIVTFTGSKHYASANAISGPTCKPGKAKVTQIHQTGKHQVHLVAVSGGGSNVYGWVNKEDIRS